MVIGGSGGKQDTRRFRYAWGLAEYMLRKNIRLSQSLLYRLIAVFHNPVSN